MADVVTGSESELVATMDGNQDTIDSDAELARLKEEAGELSDDEDDDENDEDLLTGNSLPQTQKQEGSPHNPDRREQQLTIPIHSPSPHSPSPSLVELETAAKSSKRIKQDRSKPGNSRSTEIAPEDDEQEVFRKEALKTLTDIEHEFARFREKMYQEKIAELEREDAAIRNGSHPVLVSQMRHIEQKKVDRLNAAEARLRLERISFQRQFEAAVSQARTDFICKRGELRRQMIAEIEHKRWKMYDEKRKLESSDSGHPSSLVPDRAACVKRRKALKAELSEWRAIIASGGFPAATISGLSKNEINEDLESIGIQNARSHSGAAGRGKKHGVHNGKATADIITSASPSDSITEAMKRANDTSPSYEVRSELEMLRYQGTAFRRNDKAYLCDSGSKYSVKIIGFTSSELLVQRTDGSKTKIPIEQLEDGRMQLQPKGQG
ncbi:hypothetical protein SpCBS45565_g03631 [Spizellomyces sp. 'palustris']|nr:hypothetical protein SpCBS45565_g03631 [Spizellomyces sp. 'palustris']